MTSIQLTIWFDAQYFDHVREVDTRTNDRHYREMMSKSIKRYREHKGEKRERVGPLALLQDMERL